jgi:hypothetical protein
MATVSIKVNPQFSTVVEADDTTDRRRWVELRCETPEAAQELQKVLRRLCVSVWVRVEKNRL